MPPPIREEDDVARMKSAFVEKRLSLFIVLFPSPLDRRLVRIKHWSIEREIPAFPSENHLLKAGTMEMKGYTSALSSHAKTE